MEVKTMEKVTSFALDIETYEFINDKKWELKKSRSELLRKILKYFIDHPNELQKIITGENNIE